MSKIPELEHVPDVSLVPETMESLLEEIVAMKEALWLEETGESIKLAPASPEMLDARVQAYFWYQLFALIDRGAKMNLVTFSYGAWLDNVAANKGVFRKPAQAAACTLRFFASDTLPFAVSIPAGTRVRTESDAVFATEQYAEIPPLQPWVDVRAVALELGLSGNGYPPGFVHQMIDTPPYIRAAENLDTTGGGDDIENDDRLTYRYLMEWTRHNTAGSREAYVFWTRQFRGDIGTVAAYRSAPGEVTVLLLMEDGSPPESILIDQLYEFLNDENKRPLGDDLYIRAPQDVYYTIEMEYTILARNANRAGSIQEAVREAVQEYIRRQTRIGACINPDELVNLVIGAGAHRCPVISPQWQMIPHDHIARLDGEPVIRYLGLEDR